MIRGRLRLHRHPHGAEGEAEPEYIEIDPSQLTGIIRVPQWLRDAGLMSWLLVGIGLLIVAMIWLLGLTQVIVAPLITAGVIAAVASPLVRHMNAIRIPRGVGAGLVLLGIVAIGAGVVVMIVNGITGQSSDIGAQLSSAKDTLAGWLQDLGLDPSKADAAKDSASQGVSDSADALLNGLTASIEKLSSLVFFLALTTLSLFFLLMDGPKIRAWTERHSGIPTPLARTITQRVLGSLRGYFLGVTIIAAFNAVVVTLGCLILGVPLIGTIAAVTFVGAYIPYLGAWSAAGFSVLIALGSSGPEAAGGMIIVQLLANGVLQQMVQPLAMGAALGIHPLAVLIVTIGGGALFGAVGLILAAPLTSAIVRISADVSRAKAEAEGKPESPHPDDAAQAAPA
jgi:predicted PurR-regulated permease PerM